MQGLMGSLFAAAFLQNVVLMTGFGSSILIRISRKRRNLLPFSGFLCLFSVLTSAICYPLDALAGTGVLVKWLRPCAMVIVSALLYCIVALVLRRLLPAVYTRICRLLPLAAFNNLVIGLAIIANHQFAVTFWETIGMSLGACGGFLILSWLTAEGMERMDNPDVPKAFRGLPLILMYLGILALALMGFSGSVSLL